MSKYWKTGEKNKLGKECYKLHFTQFYDDEVVAGFVQDEEDDNVFIYTSKEMNVEYDTIIADSIEDAKEQIAEMLVEHWNDEINYLEKGEKVVDENGEVLVEGQMKFSFPWQ